jgi:two-component system response regulator (stage 0 sporulation protein F)
MVTIKPLLLVVDDHPGIRYLLTKVLSDEGYAVIEATSGPAALQKAKDFCPALILLDMKLPGKNGFEMLQDIKRSGLSTKVIMMTAYDELYLLNAARKLGANDCVTKPFDIIDLCRRVERVLAQSSQTNRLMVG